MMIKYCLDLELLCDDDCRMVTIHGMVRTSIDWCLEGVRNGYGRYPFALSKLYL
jgi:hypothetical protein